MPIPPYRAAPAPPSAGERAPSDERRPCVVCPAGRIAPIPSPVARGDVKDVEPPDAGLLARASGVSESFLASEKRNQPERPVERPPQKTRLYDPHISPALLTHRVEPVFPPLAQQLRRSGKVELHALIAANGTIESLQVVSGDPMFLQSAIDAVKQWRYQPTLLNGHPVEVDTFITVIYTLDSR